MDFPAEASCLSPSTLYEMFRNLKENSSSDPADDYFVAATGDEWTDLGAAMAPSRDLYGCMWGEGELCCLFADTNLGKTILAVQIGVELAKTEPVLYVDFEMNTKQWQARMTDGDTGEKRRLGCNFHRLEYRPKPGVTISPQVLLHHIVGKAEMIHSRIIIIDNLMWICDGSECGQDAQEFMTELKRIKEEKDLSILVIGHTPKRDKAEPITDDSLAGSKKLMNNFDSAFAIGEDITRRPAGRYIKQIKTRRGPYEYGADSVLRCEIRKFGNILEFYNESPDDTATERSLITPPRPSGADTGVRDAEIAERLARGESYEKIHADMRVSKSTIAAVKKRLSA